MNIRLARVTDARSIAEVQVRTWQATYRGILPDAYLDALSVDKREHAFRDGLMRASPEMWVAESDSGVVGWIAFGASRDADATATTGEIEAIYVLPEHWSTGTGRELWKVAQARLLARNFTAATLWVLEANERAARFYRAAGFTPEAGCRKAIHIGGQEVWEVRYACALAPCPFDAPRPASNEHWDFIGTLSISSLYLSKNQTYRGYSLLMFDAGHVEQIDRLRADEWAAFASDLFVANRAINRALRPDHMNVELLGNVIAHLHWHIVPRFRTDARWGSPIWTTTPAEMPMTRIAESEQLALVEQIRGGLT